MTLKEKDFIEIVFTGKIKDGEVFDSNDKKVLESFGKVEEKETKPFVFALGQGMFLKGVDAFLIGKEVGSYTLDLKPEEAFGKRDPKLVTMVPISFFKQSNLNPVKGQTMSFDGRMGRIVTVSGGRVLVDFNNPLAGKEVTYEVKILKIVDDIKEKVHALFDFFVRKEIPFEIKDKTVIAKVEKGMQQFLDMFKEKFKEIVDLELVVEEKK